MELPTIGVMILNRNGREWLGPLYDSLRTQSYPKLIVYLIDNASTDDSVTFTQTNFSEVRILRFSENLGYSMAYNRAMTEAFSDGCEWVIWANNDVILESGCLAELAMMTHRDDRIGVIGPAFYAWDSNVPNYYMLGKHPSAIIPMSHGSIDPLKVDWVEGSFLMVSATCVRDVGGLDPFLFFYWEETDFCRRARRKGWDVVLAVRAIARHYAGGWSSGNHKNVATANSLKSRNQYIYALADPNQAFVVNIFTAIHLFLVLLKAAVKTSPASVGYELKVLWNAVCELPEIRGKWRRDRAGIPPPQTTKKYLHVTMERISAVGSPTMGEV